MKRPISKKDIVRYRYLHPAISCFYNGMVITGTGVVERVIKSRGEYHIRDNDLTDYVVCYEGEVKRIGRVK